MGIWRGLSRAIWGFGVNYLGLFGIWRELSGVIFPTSWNFLGNHDDNNRSGDTARYYYHLWWQEAKIHAKISGQWLIFVDVEIHAFVRSLGGVAVLGRRGETGVTEHRPLQTRRRQSCSLRFSKRF